MTELVREDEIKEIIVKLKISKTLGIDGFAGGYYKISKDERFPILKCTVLNSGNPAMSWSEVIITVHPKSKRPFTV